MSVSLALEWRYVVDGALADEQPWNRTPIPELTPVHVRLIEPLPSVGVDPLGVSRDALVDYLADVLANSSELTATELPARDYAQGLAALAVATLHPTYEAHGAQLDPTSLRVDAIEMLLRAGGQPTDSHVELVVSLLKTLRGLSGEAQRVREAYGRSCREREQESWELAQELSGALDTIATVKRTVRNVRTTPPGLRRRS